MAKISSNSTNEITSKRIGFSEDCGGGDGVKMATNLPNATRTQYFW